MRIITLFTVCWLSLSSTSSAGDWPAFRGPHGTGLSDEVGIPTRWDAETNIKWKAPLPEAGNGSPIVVDGRVLVNCPEDRGSKRHLLCFDRHSGELLWKRTAEFQPDWPTHKTNPHSASTPASNGEVVVAWHASAGLFCYDLQGNQRWSRQLGEFKHMWGDGVSPLIDKDRVILHCGPGKEVFITALSLNDGETLWRTDEPVDGDGDYNSDRKYMGSWATPVLANVDGQHQVICTMATRVNGYDPDSGELLWSCDGIRGPKGDLAYSSPLIADDFCVAIGGFNGPSIGFRLGGRGNITDENRRWRVESNPQSIGSGVFLGDHIYRPNAGPGTIECLSASSGELLWTDRAGGGTYWGSIVAADGHLLVTNQDGTTVVFKPNPQRLELVSTNPLGEPSNSTPAISDGNLFIRTHGHLYCIEAMANE